MRIFLGIDPGKSGGIAVIGEGGKVYQACRMPERGRAMLDMFGRELVGLMRFGKFEAVATVEHVWSMPGQGHGGAFDFGRSVESVQMGLVASDIPFGLVIPRKWQAALSVKYPKGSSDVEKKNITKARAAKLFPRIAVTHAIADALLLAEYCRRLHLGLLSKSVTRKGRR
jgi:hypothetical protein